MSLPLALEVAIKLKASLATEVTRSQESRAVLKTLDTPALLSQASLREAFNQHSAYLASELARHLGVFAGTHGMTDVTLEQVRMLAPFEGEQLTCVFAEIRALSQALRELDDINQQLAEKALTVVRAYVTHLAPRPSAYTRRGQHPEVESGTHSERA
jgi:hypothetical protein